MRRKFIGQKMFNYLHEVQVYRWEHPGIKLKTSYEDIH